MAKTNTNRPESEALSFVHRTADPKLGKGRLDGIAEGIFEFMCHVCYDSGTGQKCCLVQFGLGLRRGGVAVFVISPGRGFGHKFGLGHVVSEGK